MTVFKDEGEAFEAVRRKNRMVAGPQGGTSARTELWVVVDGPNDRDFTVMTVEEAIEDDFMYRWIA